MSPVHALSESLYAGLAASTALTGLLAGGSLGMFDTLAPQGSSTPLVVYKYMGGGDDNTTQTRARSVVYMVKAIAENLDTAQQIDDKIDAALHNQELTISGWGNWWTARESDVAYAEDSAGVLVWHVGGLYRIRIEES